MGNNYSQLLEKKQAKLEKLYGILEDTKGKIKALESEINTIKLTQDAEQFVAFKKDLAAKNNVDAILSAIRDGRIDLSAYSTRQPAQTHRSFSQTPPQQDLGFMESMES